MPITVATYNAENFFDSHQIGEYDRPKSAGEVYAMARVLDEMDADIITFQEVESEQALERMNGLLKNGYEYYALIPGNYYRGLHLGFLSRFPFTTTSHADIRLRDSAGNNLQEYATPDSAAPTPLRFQRDVLRGDFRISANQKLSIFNVHLKSKSTNEWRLLTNDEIRAAEAAEARRLVASFDNGTTPVIVAGDFNDEQDRTPVRRLVHDLGYLDVIERDWVPHYLPSYTYNKYPFHSRIDYLLLNKAAENAYVPNSVWVREGEDAKRASDHYPVSLELAL